MLFDVILEAIADFVEVLETGQVVQIVSWDTVMSGTVFQALAFDSLGLTAGSVVDSGRGAIPHLSDDSSAFSTGGEVVQDVGLRDGIEVTESVDTFFIFVLDLGTTLLELSVGVFSETGHSEEGEED